MLRKKNLGQIDRVRGLSIKLLTSSRQESENQSVFYFWIRQRPDLISSRKRDGLVRKYGESHEKNRRDFG